MLKLKEAEKIFEDYICQTYGKRRLVLSYGSGLYIFDTENKKYLDFLSGLAVSSMGHNHPKIVKALNEQAQKLIHCSNLYFNEPQSRLAKNLIEQKMPGYKLFFCNSGAEANEAAIKLTRKFTNNPEKSKIITFKNSFHGRTMATITATGQTKYNESFKPLLPIFEYADFNDINSVKRLIDKNTAAVMLELIQCEGGVNISSKKFIQELSELCSANKLLLILDEVQTGAGRTGKFFCFEHYNIKPDIVTLAKGIAAGVPMGIMFAKKEIADAFKPGDHASTFGGNPLACAAALEVLKFLNDKNLQKIYELGEYFKTEILSLKNPLIKEARGLGLMIGIELNKKIADDIQLECEKSGLLINSIHNEVLRIAPPLIVKKSEIDKALKIIETALKKY
ncbi:MAG TPA: aspartate aminotransferase family protein [bacterium]|nr:aspartate aminotransferase family protein [bacterium]